MADGVKGRWTPLMAKLMARLMVSMKDGMAARRGCCSPRPPFDKERVDKMWEWAGMECTPISSCRNSLSIDENLLQRLLDQRFHCGGRLDVEEDATSDAKRCVSLWTVHVLKTRSIVCLSLRPWRIFLESDRAASTRDKWKFSQNVSLPMGTPRMRKPLTSSCMEPSLFLEKVSIADLRESCVDLLDSLRSSRMLLPLVEVRIRVFSVFMIAPSGSAISLKASNSGLTSSRWTRKLASST